MLEKEIDALFTFRKWTEEEVKKFSPLREIARNYAHEINRLVPDSPEKTLAIRALHLCTIHTNTAITLHHKEVE